MRNYKHTQLDAEKPYAAYCISNINASSKFSAVFFFTLVFISTSYQSNRSYTDPEASSSFLYAIECTLVHGTSFTPITV